MLKTCPKGGPKRCQCYPLIRFKRVFFQLLKFSYKSRAQKPHEQRTRTGVRLPPGKSNYTSGGRRRRYPILRAPTTGRFAQISYAIHKPDKISFRRCIFQFLPAKRAIVQVGSKFDVRPVSVCDVRVTFFTP